MLSNVPLRPNRNPKPKDGGFRFLGPRYIGDAAAAASALLYSCTRRRPRQRMPIIRAPVLHMGLFYSGRCTNERVRRRPNMCGARPSNVVSYICGLYYPIQVISYLSVLQFSDSAGVGGLERSQEPSNLPTTCRPTLFFASITCMSSILRLLASQSSLTASKFRLRARYMRGSEVGEGVGCGGGCCCCCCCCCCWGEPSETPPAAAKSGSRADC